MHTQKSDRQECEAPKAVSCPRCGKLFFCELSHDCWCSRKTVPPEVRTYLAIQYQTCVCSDCLDWLIAEALSGRSR